MGPWPTRIARKLAPDASSWGSLELCCYGVCDESKVGAEGCRRGGLQRRRSIGAIPLYAGG